MPTPYRLSYEDRQNIKEMYDNGEHVGDIAAAICVDLSTIYREIRRGAVGFDYDSYIYDPDVGQQRAEQARKARGGKGKHRRKYRKVVQG